MLDFRQSTLRKRTQRHHPKMPPRSPLVRWLFRSTLALFATLSVLAGVQARAEPGGSLTFIEVRVEALADIAMQQVAVAARQSDGNLGIVAWQQTERPNHFNLISGWNSESQFHAFAATRARRESSGRWWHRC
jgi:quinol monooxygenase YgiN